MNLILISSQKHNTALVYFGGPNIFGDFVNLKIEAVRGHTFQGSGAVPSLRQEEQETS